MIKSTYSKLRKYFTSDYKFEGKNYKIPYVNKVYEDIKPYKKANKVIYCFWTGDNEMSENRLNALSKMQENCGVEIKLITKQTLDEFILPDFPLHKSYKYLSDVHKSDYLRTYFMHHYGGGYSDVKPHTNNWEDSFRVLNLSEDSICTGYPEISAKDIGYIQIFHEKKNYSKLNRDMKYNFTLMIGNGSYIFKPRTPFTYAWIDELHRRLDIVEAELLKNPGNIWGDNEGYPLPWTSILGQIFHPLCLKHYERMVIDERIKPVLKNYR